MKKITKLEGKLRELLSIPGASLCAHCEKHDGIIRISIDGKVIYEQPGQFDYNTLDWKNEYISHGICQHHADDENKKLDDLK